MKTLTLETQVIIFLAVVLPTMLTLGGMYYFVHLDTQEAAQHRTDVLHARIAQICTEAAANGVHPTGCDHE